MKRFHFIVLSLLTYAIVIFTGGCGGSQGNSGKHDEWSFPSGFMFGTATAGFQVDMGCPYGSGIGLRDKNSDWYAYMTDPELLQNSHTYLSGEDPAITGPGHWELFESDHGLAKNELFNNAFRMSIEWSRIFPTSTEGIEGYDALRAVANHDALDKYHAMFASLKAHGLRPFVTLHHYTLPLWIHDGPGCMKDIKNCSPRGWLDPDRIVPEIAKYAGFAAKEFGAEVDLWATQNEPFAVILAGFVQPNATRSNLPAQMFDANDAKTALLTMEKAHARMVDAVRANDLVDADGDGMAAQVAIVYAMAPIIPLDPASDIDVKGTQNIFYLWNLMFLDAVALGQVDENLDGTKTFVEEMADRLDFIGLNYYQSLVMEGMEKSMLPSLSPLLTLNPLTLNSSQVHSRGLYEMLMLLTTRYKRPIIISENNGQKIVTGNVSGELNTVVANLEYLLLAINAGADVRGYFYWSLTDNIEWNQGTTAHWGLYAIDPADASKKRTARAIVPVYAEISHTASIPADIRLQYGTATLDGSPTGGVPDAGIFLPVSVR